MRVPMWLTLSVGLLVLVWGAFRVRIGLRNDVEQEEAEQRRGLYALPRRTHLLLGVVYMIMGGMLIATSFGWNPLRGLFASRTPAPAASGSGSGTGSGTP